MKRIAALIALLAGLIALAVAPGPQAAHAAVLSPAVKAVQAAPAAVTDPAAHVARAAVPAYLGSRILNEAETRTGDWYSYGAAGPSAFDCSGLVYWAAHAAGVRLYSRTTYQLLADSGHFYPVPVSQARRGDLMFFGSGHVEIKTIWYHGTFGAQQTGTRVGWHEWSGWWQPTMALRWR